MSVRKGFFILSVSILVTMAYFVLMLHDIRYEPKWFFWVLVVFIDLGFIAFSIYKRIPLKVMFLLLISGALIITIRAGLIDYLKGLPDEVVYYLVYFMLFLLLETPLMVALSLLGYALFDETKVSTIVVEVTNTESKETNDEH